MDFQLKTNRQGNDIVLSMSGRLDTLSAAELATAVKDIVSQQFDSVDVEISGLSYISSSGLRCFVELFKACKSRGAAFTITGMQPAVREIFNLTGFTKVFGLD